MLIDNPVVQKADMIFAVGGGRAVDTCKVVFTKLDKPFSLSLLLHQTVLLVQQ